MATSGVGRTARDDEASAPCAGHYDITQSSSRITNTPCMRSGADAGRFPHWPHPGGGASSSATSTTAWSPAAGTGVGDADATTVASPATAAAVVSSCCVLVATAVSRSGSPVAVALAAAHGALGECRLVVAGTPNLGAFAGVRARTSDVTLRMRKHKGEHRPSKFRVRAGSTTHLKLKKPRFLFLEGSGAPL
jgi:hypothetical protein